MEEKIAEIRWKRIYLEGKPTDYHISDYGMVYSEKSKKFLSAALNSDGYPQVILYTNNGKFTIAIHRLVAIYFVDNPDPSTKVQVNHKDGNKEHNWYWNLEWTTCKENIDHAVNNGLRDTFKGVNSPKNVYSESVIRNICQMLEDGRPQKYIADTLGVNKGIVNSIKQKKIWKHISCEYNIPKPISRKPRNPNLRADVINILNNGTYSNREILNLLGLPDTKTNRTYVAVIKCETKSKV